MDYWMEQVTKSAADKEESKYHEHNVMLVLTLDVLN